MIPVKEVNIPDVDAVAELLPQLLIGPSFFPDAMNESIFFNVLRRIKKTR